FARFTDFDGSGVVTGGFGFESVMTATSHSSYNALQTSLSGNVGHGGPSLQAGYTWGKSLDDVSGIIGGTGSTGAVTLFSPQNPFDTRAERGPSSFDVTHAFTLSAAQDLHFEHLGIQSDRTHLLTKGWELLSISSITSGSPFTVKRRSRVVRRLRFIRVSSRRARERLARTGRTRLGYRTYRAPAVQPDRATIILGGARTTQASLPFRS